MHADQVPVDAAVVARLIAEQLPRWRDEPVVELRPSGTVNAIFRVGSELSARFPLRAADPVATAAALAAEAAAMRALGECCPVPTPAPVAIGRPGHGYPLPWAVQTWVRGELATPGGLADSTAFAEDLVGILRAFRGADVGGRRFSGTGRGGLLVDLDDA